VSSFALRRATPVLAAAIGAAVLLPATAGAATAPTAPTFSNSASDIRSALPADGSVRKGVLARLNAASRALKRNDPCDARKALGGIRSLALKPGAGRPSLSQRAELAAASLQAESLALFRSSAASCGGAKTPPVRRLGVKALLPAAGAPQNVFSIDVRNPTPQFQPAEGGNTPFVMLDGNGLGRRGVVGEPGTPSSTHLIAVPQGAKVSIRNLKTAGITLPNVDLSPEQAPEPEQEPGTVPVPPGTGRFDDPALQPVPFQRDPGAYNSDSTFPRSPITLRGAGDYRGLQLVAVDVSAALSKPKKRQTRYLTRVQFDVVFTGGTGKYADQRITAADEQPFLQALAPQIVNAKLALSPSAIQNIQLRACGENMLIFTTPALRSAADRYATARTNAGVVTRVFNVGEGGLTTPEAIRQFIMGRIFNTDCARRPRNVLLLGDHPAVPAFSISLETGGSTVSDFYYGLKSTGFFIQSAAVGRIPATNIAEADAAVDKLINYQAAPPTDPNFYNRALVAGFFQYNAESTAKQESRTFVQDTEKARTALMAIGKTVDRYHTRQSGSDPERYSDGTAIPASLQLPTFAWNDTGTEIRDAVNNGRYLLLHRDHGYWAGWGDPGFNLEDGSAAAAGLTNGNKLPLVLSINCSSGQFDLAGGAKSFAESMILDGDGGAMAVFAAARTTWTPTNSPLSRALIQGLTGRHMFTTAGASVGAATGYAPITNTGELLFFGKIIMLLKTSASSESVRDTFRLFNQFGDPSLPVKISL